MCRQKYWSTSSSPQWQRGNLVCIYHIRHLLLPAVQTSAIPVGHTWTCLLQVGVIPGCKIGNWLLPSQSTQTHTFHLKALAPPPLFCVVCRRTEMYAGAMVDEEDGMVSLLWQTLVYTHTQFCTETFGTVLFLLHSLYIHGAASWRKGWPGRWSLFGAKAHTQRQPSRNIASY
jgi:hypothetical protein